MKTFFRCEFCHYTSNGGTVGDKIDMENHEATCKHNPYKNVIPTGLKDHQIQEMVNKIRDNVEPITNYQCLRSLINDAVMKYLEDSELRIDKK